MNPVELLIAEFGGLAVSRALKEEGYPNGAPKTDAALETCAAKVRANIERKAGGK